MIDDEGMLEMMRIGCCSRAYVRGGERKANEGVNQDDRGSMRFFLEEGDRERGEREIRRMLVTKDERGSGIR